MRYRIRRHGQNPAELNITAFMNLMVILVPFLLITAVFSRMTVIQLNLPPGGGDDPAQAGKKLELEVVIRPDRLVVQDRNTGPLKIIPDQAGGHDYLALENFLKRVKAQFPERTEATILSEPDTPYETLVKVMDTVRIARVIQGTSVIRAELFPDIAIGDAAPERPAGAAGTRG